MQQHETTSNLASQVAPKNGCGSRHSVNQSDPSRSTIATRREVGAFPWCAGNRPRNHPYPLGDYAEVVEVGRRSWTLNRNWPLGLTYVVAGLAQLGRIDEAQAALADLRGLDPNFSFVRTTVQRLYTDKAGIDHLLDGCARPALISDFWSRCFLGPMLKKSMTLIKSRDRILRKSNALTITLMQTVGFLVMP